MSEPRINPFSVDQDRQLAMAFMRMKGRMPKDFHEMVDWLIEFNVHQTEQLRLLHKVFEEHMETCTRPILIQKDHP